jgi:hypothetical protein
LDAHELSRFSNYFLQSEERHQKFHFGRLLQEAIRTYNFAREDNALSAPKPSWMQIFHLPAFGYAAAAAALALAAGLAWSGYRLGAAEQGIESAQLEQMRLRNQAEGAESSSRELRSQMAAFANALAGASAAAVIELSPGTFRTSNGGFPEVSIEGATALRVSLLFRNARLDSTYRAALFGSDGKEIGSGFPAVPTSKSSSELTAMLPADLMGGGEYSIRLTQGGEDLGIYRFFVRR